MRRILRKIAENDLSNLGEYKDTWTRNLTWDPFTVVNVKTLSLINNKRLSL